MRTALRTFSVYKLDRRFNAALIFVFSFLPTRAQFDLNTNAWTEPEAVNTHRNIAETQNADTAMAELPCGPEIFYTVDNAGTICYHQLSASGVTTLGTLLTQTGLRSLAVNTNFSGGLPNTTFYGDSVYSNSVYAPRYYNTAGWDSPAPLPPPNMSLLNCGGFGQYCYYMAYSGSSGLCQNIMGYDGVAWQAIYTVTGQRQILAADLGVDHNGNVYFFENYWAQNMMSDSVYVISPSGQILAQHAVQVDTYHAYGAMVMNGIFYMAFGGSNAANPNTLVPFTVTAASLSVGTPISFLCANYCDLAGCNPGVITSVVESLGDDGHLQVWPVPSTGIINFVCGAESEWMLFNAEGRMVMQGKCNGAAAIDMVSLAPGIYFLRTEDVYGEIRKARVVVE